MDVSKCRKEVFEIMIKLIPLSKKVEVICTHKPVQLSETRQDEIENFWADVNKDGKFYRGEVFDIESVSYTHLTLPTILLV